MKCTKCRSRLRVVESRPTPNGRRRRYRCLKCDARLTTLELTVFEDEGESGRYRAAAPLEESARILDMESELDEMAIARADAVNEAIALREKLADLSEVLARIG